jgi:hypothetical protein
MATSSAVGSLPYLVEKLHQVGWFIPPFVSVGWIGKVAALIDRAGVNFSQAELEQALSALFPPDTLASMVVDRYPKTPVIKDFQTIIAESVKAHFSNLDHIAASGLVPVIEGATRRLAENQGVETQALTGTAGTIAALIQHCKTHVVARRIGDVGEIVSMLESFEMFLSKLLFANTRQYSLTDGTNRHGMVHGKFADKEFGSPLNFYKVVTSVNALTFISSLYYGGSAFVPDQTTQSTELARYYDLLSRIASEQRP